MRRLLTWVWAYHTVSQSPELAFLKGDLFWKAALALSPDISRWISTFLLVPSFPLHGSWRQSWQGKECLLLLWTQGWPDLKNVQQKENRIVFVPLPTHPGIYNLPLPISLPARLGLGWEWAEAGKQAAMAEAWKPSQDSQRAVSWGHAHFFLLKEGSR